MSVYSAIADPVRREVLLLLRSGPRTAGQIAASFDISRPAVSRHLRVLREAHLIEAERGQDGRERAYALRPSALREVEEWIAAVRGPARFAELLGSPALDTEVSRARRDSRRTAQQREVSIDPTRLDERGTG
ncbi:metalloregulator ArsR/SmtB family transcription factor [Nocardiopsis tropica]|uniref:metalloregulator ArsR/SmtB family transcription factor n=1 Tax=Tsukamurella strandjordii TaxID=147577 RepID=UPI0031D5AF50